MASRELFQRRIDNLIDMRLAFAMDANLFKQEINILKQGIRSIDGVQPIEPIEEKSNPETGSGWEYFKKNPRG